MESNSNGVSGKRAGETHRQQHPLAMRDAPHVPSLPRAPASCPGEGRREKRGPGVPQAARERTSSPVDNMTPGGSSREAKQGLSRGKCLSPGLPVDVLKKSSTEHGCSDRPKKLGPKKSGVDVPKLVVVCALPACALPANKRPSLVQAIEQAKLKRPKLSGPADLLKIVPRRPDFSKNGTARLPNGQKLSTSNQQARNISNAVSLRKKDSAEKVPHFPNGDKNIRMLDSSCNPPGFPKLLLSNQRGGSSIDKSVAVVGVPQNAGQKRLGSDLNVMLKKKSVTWGDQMDEVRLVSPVVPVEKSTVDGRVKDTNAGPSFQAERGAAAVRSAGQAWATGGSSSKGLVDKIFKKASVEQRPGYKFTSPRDRRAPTDNHTASSSDRDQGKPHVLPVEKFFNVSWQGLLETGLRKGQVLLFQNLDPWFSSFEIKDLLQQLLRCHCDVRMLPPKDFSSYISGEALVVFRTVKEAEDAFSKFTENVLIWSKDERPVVVSVVAHLRRPPVSPFHGFLDMAKFKPHNSHYQWKRNGRATSHCSQPNTVEYDMGIRWRLLQDQNTEAWKVAAQEHKDAMDHLALRHKR